MELKEVWIGFCVFKAWEMNRVQLWQKKTR
jgi:hypothetical protein